MKLGCGVRSGYQRLDEHSHTDQNSSTDGEADRHWNIDQYIVQDAEHCRHVS